MNPEHWGNRFMSLNTSWCFVIVVTKGMYTLWVLWACFLTSPNANAFYDLVSLSGPKLPSAHCTCAHNLLNPDAKSDTRIAAIYCCKHGRHFPHLLYKNKTNTKHSFCITSILLRLPHHPWSQYIVGWRSPSIQIKLSIKDKEQGLFIYLFFSPLKSVLSFATKWRDVLQDSFARVNYVFSWAILQN